MKRNIYTLTLSPAFDYVLKFNNFEKNKTNRALFRDMYAAGKGVHVSMLLKNLNQESEAIIFTSGNLEEYFLNDLTKNNVKFKNFKSEEEIRINLKLIDHEQTESNVISPKISQEEIDRLKQYLSDNLKEDDLVVISGSSPEGLGKNVYFEIGQIVTDKSAHLVVDAFGPLLTNTFKAKPFLIKPNLEELELTSQRKLTSLAEIIEAGQEIINQGVENVLVSLGKDGAMLITKEKTYIGSIPKTNLELVNAAGAGDSLLAGFIKTYFDTHDFEQALKFGIISGSATAYSNRIASLEMINNLLKFSQTIEMKVINNE